MYIVTGGAGFIGSACIWKLNAMGIDDILVVDNLDHSEKWKNLVNRSYADYVHKNAFMELLHANRLPEQVEAVIHMGACSSTTETDADYLMRNNFHFSRDLCIWTLAKGGRFINASSAATYGDGSQGFDDDPARLSQLKPLNMYGYSKQLFDLWAKRTGVLDQVASLKFFNVFGPNEYHKGDMMSVVCKAYAQIGETGRLKLFKSYRPEFTDGGQRRDFIYVKDCVEVIGWLLDHRTANGVFNVGTGQARSWNELAAAVFAAMDRPLAIDYIDMPPTLREKYQYYTQSTMTRLAAAGCPTRCTSLEDAVRDYVQTYLAGPDRYL